MRRFATPVGQLDGSVSMTGGAPVFRTRKRGDKALSFKLLVLIGVTTWIGPSVLLALLGGAIVGIAAVLGLDGVRDGALSLTGLVVMVPFVGLYAVPLAMLVGAWAMRIGWAGWAMALLVAIAGPVAVAVGILMDGIGRAEGATGAMPVLSPFLAIHAGVLWIATWKLCPEALI